MIALVNLSGLLFLIYFSYLDIKKSEIGNEIIFFMIASGIMLLFLSGQIITLSLVCAIWFCISYLLWTLNTIGGADVKILTILPIFYLIALPNILFNAWIFLILFGVLGFLFGILIKKLTKKKYVPFVPIITLTYIIFWGFQLIK